MVQQHTVKCSRCEEFCQGETVRVFDSYYHVTCFSCGVIGCAQDLVTDGYFSVEGEVYCRRDYHKMKGRKCSGCSKYVEGEVISVLNTVYHTRCFACITCAVTFPPNAEIFYDGDGLYCDKCVKNTDAHRNIPTSVVRRSMHELTSSNGEITSSNGEITTSCRREVTTCGGTEITTRDAYDVTTNECYGCKEDMNSSQIVIALDHPWHVACFKCHQCASLLTGDYMERDGQPYCERDYHENFGVTCDNCREFITGKVLQAGDKLYHPHCSTCALCRLNFQEGEEMFLQGEYIWHPACSEKLKADQEEKRNKRRGTVFLDYDSEDYLTDSTFPTTENYDASRSFNDLSDATLNDDVSLLSHPLSERSLESYRNLLQHHSRKNYKVTTTQDIRNANIISNLRSSQQVSTTTTVTRTATTSKGQISRARTDSCGSEGCRNSGGQGLAHSSPKSTPGCFRNVNYVLNGGSRRNSPRSGARNNSNQYARGSPRLKGSPRSRDSPRSTTEGRAASPPISSDTPPPKPPPPTWESSKKWHHKHTHNKNVKSTSTNAEQQQKSRRDSFSKAITIGTDESSESTDSERNPSTVNTSSSNEEDSMNELEKSYTNNLKRNNNRKNDEHSVTTTTKVKVNGIKQNKRQQNHNRMTLYEDKNKDAIKEALPTFQELSRTHYATSYA